MLLGSWLSGSVVDHYAYIRPGGAMMHCWQSIWLIPAACSTSALILFIPTFSDSERIAQIADIEEARPGIPTK